MDWWKPYPKIWGVGNPGVARGAQRHLGKPFQVHTADNGLARNKGQFSEIIIEEGVKDGWFAASTGAFSPTFVRGTPRPRTKWTKRGVLPANTGVTRFHPGIFPSGDGWAYVTQMNASPGPGLISFDFRKSTDGGRHATQLFEHVQALPLENIGVADWFFPMHWDVPGVLMQLPVFAAEDITRQKPQTRWYFKDEGTWFTSDLTMPEFDLDADYTFGQFASQAPGAWMFTSAKFGELPVLYVTFNLGADWGGWVMDETNFFPDLDMPDPADWDWETEDDAPGSTPDERRAAWVSQQEVQDLAGMSHPGIEILSLRRALVMTIYPTAYRGTWRHTTTLFDFVNGVVEDQWFDTYELNRDNRFSIPLGEDSWLSFNARWTPNGTNPNAAYAIEDIKWTADAGGSFTTPTPESEVRMFGPIVGAARPYEDTPVYAKIYYTVLKAGGLELWATSDNFSDEARQSQIAPSGSLSYNYDYIRPVWVGQPGLDAAPCDPCVPWRTDNRVPLPTWWYDGLTP